MTTYYYYGEDGRTYKSTQALKPPSEDPVGHYIAQRASYYHHYAENNQMSFAPPSAQNPQVFTPGSSYQIYGSLDAHHLRGPPASTHVQQSNDHVLNERPEQGNWSGENYGSYNVMAHGLPDHTSTIGHTDGATHSNQHQPYPDPDQIRHLHTLYSLLPYIQPKRRLHSLAGPKMDIMTHHTRHVLAEAVPKKLLVLFLGRKIVNKFIWTVERQDNKNWKGPPTRQILYLPRASTSSVAVQHLVSWMTQACQPHTMEVMQPIKIPVNVFTACSLAQTMALLGLHKDALFADSVISEQHFQRPISASELGTLWRCMEPNNRYVYGAINAARKWFKIYDDENSKHSEKARQVLVLFEKHPELAARVRDPSLNERYRPSIGVEWMQNLANHPVSNARNIMGGGTQVQPNGNSNLDPENQDTNRTEGDMQPSSDRTDEEDAQLSLNAKRIQPVD